MTEWLTDEQVIFWRKHWQHRDGEGPAALAAFKALDELLALRAERAQPPQSDDERARELIKAIECNGDDDPNPWDVMMAKNAFASIRAEGSAEQAELEAEHPSWPIGTFVMKTKGAQWRGHVVGYYSTALTTIGYCVESIMEPGSVQIYPQAALALAQPAESRATEKPCRCTEMLIECAGKVLGLRGNAAPIVEKSADYRRGWDMCAEAAADVIGAIRAGAKP